MLENLADGYRKLSWALLLAGLYVMFWTEATSDVKIGRHGKPKPPLSQQRLVYSCFFIVAVPGCIWGLARAINHDSKTPWD